MCHENADFALFYSEKGIFMSHKIGITACSNPMHPSFSADLARLCQILRELGFDPVLSPCLFDNGSGFSGTGTERADALMNLYCDPEITDIFDVSGGDMANEVLPYLDFSVIAASGKRFWGYSDLTTIVNAVTTATGMSRCCIRFEICCTTTAPNRSLCSKTLFPGSLPASSTSLAHFCRAITWKV